MAKMYEIRQLLTMNPDSSLRGVDGGKEMASPYTKVSTKLSKAAIYNVLEAIFPAKNSKKKGNVIP